MSVVAAVLGALAIAAAEQTPILDAAEESFRRRSVFFLTTDLMPAEIQGLERQIEQEARGPLYIAILSDFIRRVGEAREEAAAQAIEPDSASDDDNSDRWIIAALAAIAVAVVIAALAGRKRGGTGRGR